MAFMRFTAAAWVFAATSSLSQTPEPSERWKLIVALDREGGAVNVLLDSSSIALQSGFVTAVRKIIYTNTDKRSDLPAEHEEIEKIAVDCNTKHLARVADETSRDQLAWHDASGHYVEEALVEAVCRFSFALHR